MKTIIHKLLMRIIPWEFWGWNATQRLMYWNYWANQNEFRDLATRRKDD